MPNHPSWLQEACPPWCQREHLEDDHPDDRMHESSPISIPVIALTRTFDDGSLEQVLNATEFELVRYRYVDDQQEWLYLGNGVQQVEISLESARRLQRRLGEVLFNMQATACSKACVYRLR